MRGRDGDRGEPRGLGGDRVEGRHAVKELLLAGTRTVRQVVIAAEQEPAPILDDIIDLADEAGVDIRELPRGKFDQMAATDAPQGVVAFAAPLREYALEELVADLALKGSPGGADEPDKLYRSSGAERPVPRSQSAVFDDLADDDLQAGPPEAPGGDPDAARHPHGARDRQAGDPEQEPGPSDTPATASGTGDQERDVQDEQPLSGGDEPNLPDQPAGGPDGEADVRHQEADTDAAPDGTAGGSPQVLLLVVDGVTDPGNLGAILRTAECAGVTGVVLPRHRAARITPTVAKRAAGAIEHLRFAPVSGIPTALATLAELGVWSVGLEVAADQTIWELPIADAPLALVLGAEGRGLSRLVRRRCDVTARIPVTGRLDALNVSAATAVALFEVLRRRTSG